MRTRCTNPRTEDWADYGGRGITFCERWNSFQNFLEDMGRKPKGFTLDRINNDGNYCPENCRWANVSEQQRNKRTNIVVTAFGESKTLMDWFEDKRCVVKNYQSIYWRIKTSGWCGEQAILTPVGNKRLPTHANCHA